MGLRDDPQAWQALGDGGYLRGQIVNRQKLADDLANDLQAHIVERDDPAYLNDKAITLDELCAGRFGVSNDELRNLMSQLTRTGFDGSVQQALPNGLVLCDAMVERAVTGPSGTVTRKFRGRFLSKDVDVLDNRYLTPRVESGVRAAARIRADLDFAVGKVPALETRRRAALNAAADRMQRELTA
jgi:hypothetical protein